MFWYHIDIGRKQSRDLPPNEGEGALPRKANAKHFWECLPGLAAEPSGEGHYYRKERRDAL